MKNISKTLFIPFYCRFKESTGSKLIYDREAVDFFQSKKYKNIIDFSTIDKNTLAGTIARTLLIDKYLLSALDKNISENKKCNVFNIGCGLDFRNRRLNLSDISWTNIDLPEVIEFRKNNFKTFENEQNISVDIDSIDKWNFIPFENNIFILEGILMYFDEEHIIKFIKKLVKQSKKCWFIIETVPEITKTITNPSVKKISSEIIFKWGCNNIDKFANSLNLCYLEGTSTVEILKDRWDFIELEKYMKNPREQLINHRIVVLSSDTE